ncbi:neuronal acetylcholine receptor subunit alpha-3-like [Mercenaria mercenaria]|uniref:neuronal acetylcholine receptor subunit alpha-3-like n=1 Tax=Mercenaria mercenaria TaxID=6596 RepID=UPI00234EFD8E|nr:neuronal acetylcholine receptor subunit alpha-3-like [Mercenaria mercenaria]
MRRLGIMRKTHIILPEQCNQMLHSVVAAGIFTTHCESHVTYWPLDTQTCDVILSSWSYTVNEVALDFEQLHSKILTSFYQENGEWELISKDHTSRETRRESESFSRLIFTLKFRRRPLFHMLNTLFPVVLMGFLTVAVFKLSPESGERVGLALTILLAYAVYLSVMAESIPQTSLSASLLSSYIAAILFLQTLAVLLTVFYLDTYFTPEERPVPKWLQSVTSSFLSKLACVDCHTTTMKVSPNLTEVSGDKRDVSIEDYKEDNKEVWVDEVDEERSCRQYSWKEIALLLDKVTMYIYLFLVTGITVGHEGHLTTCKNTGNHRLVCKKIYVILMGETNKQFEGYLALSSDVFFDCKVAIVDFKYGNTQNPQNV